MNKLYLIFIFILLCLPVFPNEHNEIAVFIQLYNVKTYYINKPDEVQVKVTIINNSKEVYRFKIADKKILSLDFEVKTPANEFLPHSSEFIVDRNSVQYVYYREVELKPDEEYGFVVELKRFIELNQTGELEIQAVFYPNLYARPDSKYSSINSNKINFYLRPAIDTPMDEDLLDTETGVILTRKMMPPDEVVEFTVMALQAQEWEKFFLYFNMEKMILWDEEWRARYKKSTEEEKIALREDYKRYLKNTYTNSLIKVIPKMFKIEKTLYSEYSGEVEVYMEFWYETHMERRRYTYFLERENKNSYWIITDYQVVNLENKGLPAGSR